jgi:hypothetical protein
MARSFPLNFKSLINCNYNAHDASILSVIFYVLHKTTCKSVPSLIIDLLTTRKNIVFLVLTSKTARLMTITYYVRLLCLDRQLYLRPQFVLHREHSLNYNTPIATI